MRARIFVAVTAVAISGAALGGCTSTPACEAIPGLEGCQDSTGPGTGTATSDAATEAGEGSAEQNGDGDGDGCPVGSEGCPCDGGGACDPGLSCDLDVCALGTTGDGDPTTGDGDGDPTTGDGDGDPTTGDGDGDPTTGDGDGDPNNLMCGLPNDCSEANLQDCVCAGCNTNGFCELSEDCVCPDCTGEPVCRGDNCVDTGVCFPYFEGCSCADCLGHPLCT